MALRFKEVHATGISLTPTTAALLSQVEIIDPVSTSALQMAIEQSAATERDLKDAVFELARFGFISIDIDRWKSLGGGRGGR